MRFFCGVFFLLVISSLFSEEWSAQACWTEGSVPVARVTAAFEDFKIGLVSAEDGFLPRSLTCCWENGGGGALKPSGAWGYFWGEGGSPFVLTEESGAGYTTDFSLEPGWRRGGFLASSDGRHRFQLWHCGEEEAGGSIQTGFGDFAFWGIGTWSKEAGLPSGWYGDSPDVEGILLHGGGRLRGGSSRFRYSSALWASFPRGIYSGYTMALALSAGENPQGNLAGAYTSSRYYFPDRKRSALPWIFYSRLLWEPSDGEEVVLRAEGRMHGLSVDCGWDTDAEIRLLGRICPGVFLRLDWSLVLDTEDSMIESETGLLWEPDEAFLVGFGWKWNTSGAYQARCEVSGVWEEIDGDGWISYADSGWKVHLKAAMALSPVLDVEVAAGWEKDQLSFSVSCSGSGE